MEEALDLSFDRLLMMMMMIYIYLCLFVCVYCIYTERRGQWLWAERVKFDSTTDITTPKRILEPTHNL